MRLMVLLLLGVANLYCRLGVAELRLEHDEEVSPRPRGGFRLGSPIIELRVLGQFATMGEREGSEVCLSS